MIAIDNEYIPENAAQGDHPSQRPEVKNTYCEIIQLGACKLDSYGNEIGIINITVRANKIQTIPKWLISMTGMTEEKRNQGVTFPEALQKLVDFIGNDNDIWTFNGDWWVMLGNAKAYNMDLPFAKPFNRLRPLLADYGVTLGDFIKNGFDEISSGNMYKILNIELPKIEGVGSHDAAHDARSLAHSIYHLQNKKH